MPQTGQQQLEALQKDLACPACEYNLRGLYGDIVNCPECGHECDIPQLLTNKWEGPWYKVPGLRRTYLPVLISIVYFYYAINAYTYLPLVMDTYIRMSFDLFIFLLVWSASVFYVWRFFKNRNGFSVALLMHFVVPAYAIGVFGCAIAFVTIFIGLFEKIFINSVSALACTLLFWALLFIANRSEKFVAKQCIRRYVQNPPKPAD